MSRGGHKRGQTLFSLRVYKNWGQTCDYSCFMKKGSHLVFSNKGTNRDIPFLI